MGRRKLSEKNIRKIFRTGRSRTVGITLPIEIVKKLKWREKQKIVVRRSGKKIILEDWPRPKGYGRGKK